MSTMFKEMYDALKEAGASEEKASAAAIAVAAYSLDRGSLATKEDIAALRNELKEVKEDIAVLRNEVTEMRAEPHALRSELRAEIEKMGRLVIMWNVGTLIAVASLVFAILRFAGAG